MERYTCERCGDCGRGLTWIEIAFGRLNDPVCGRCLMQRNQSAAVRRAERRGWIDCGPILDSVGAPTDTAVMRRGPHTIAVGNGGKVCSIL